MKKRRFVIGDIHGAYKALLQCFERSGFNPEKDMLISLGDVADGWSQVPECFDELLKAKNLVYIMGNHDEWLRNWFKYGSLEHIWLSQGGQTTLNAYVRLLDSGDTKRQVTHQNLLEKAPFYHVVDKMLFVHGGYDWRLPIEDQHYEDLMWDRHMWKVAAYWQLQYNRGQELLKIEDYDYVFIGHTNTTAFQTDLTPVQLSNVWNVDQGAGWYGKLTIMDIDTKEYWQSDQVQELYPNEKGRRY